MEAVGSTANGLVSDNGSRATETARIAGVNLLGGLIRADAIKATVAAAGVSIG